MERYEKYKDSGVEYIGRIPIDWNVTKIKFLTSGVKTGSTPPSEEIEYFEPGEINWYGPGDFSNILLEDAKRKISKKAIEHGKCKLFGPDSILLIGIGATVGKFGKSKTHFSANQQINVISFLNEKLQADFGLYFLSTIRGIIYMTASSATLPIFNQSQTKELILPVPSAPDEQTAIANYLDKKTSELDNLISKKEKLIELLKEERTAIINQAVTKGLDPNAEMKDSQVEWLGEIPVHWKMSKLKYVSLIKYGLGQPPKQKDDGLPILRATNVFRGKISKENLVFVDPDDVPWNRDPVLKENDIIIVRSGAYTGDSAIIPFEFDGAITGYDMVLRALTVNPKFVAFALLSTYLLDNQLFLERLRAAQPHLNAEELGNSFLILPNMVEQNEIVFHIENEHQRVDELLSKTNQEITLLKEYKTALISEVVTGKVKVV